MVIPTATIKVLLVDDDALVRAGLRMMLSSAADLGALTQREREVAAVIGSGASNAAVAAALFMSEATVKAHVSRLLTKLDVANRVQIAILVHDADDG